MTKRKAKRLHVNPLGMTKRKAKRLHVNLLWGDKKKSEAAACEPAVGMKARKAR
jgi:hypothetical protein